MAKKLLLHGAREVVAVVESAAIECLKGEAMGRPVVYRSEEGLSVLCSEEGLVEAVLSDAEMRAVIEEHAMDVEAENVSGMSLLPGFVDAHSHPVWAGDRMGEFEMKLAGATYMEIHESGGGIHSTVEATRKASETELLHSFLSRCEAMLRGGTTTLEAKSGYGLDLPTELKMLRVIDAGAELLRGRLGVSGTYCGAHAVPKDSTAAEATDDVVQQLDALKEERKAGRLRSLENVDVFCERGCFSVEQARFILAKGMAIGLAGNFHGEELSCLGSAEMGAEEGVRAVSHLEEVSDEGIEAMGEAGTAAVLLPTTAFLLKLRPPPARKLIAGNVPVALGSDFNPNAHCYSMPLVMTQAAVLFGMTLPETLVAATLNAAYSLGRGRTHGALHAGRVADIVAIRSPKWQSLAYHMGGHSDLIALVVKGGRVVHRAQH